MKRWIISLVLCLCVCLLLGGLGFRVEAADVIASGSCGDSVKWTLDSDGVLTIRGSGKMYSYLASAPWYSQRESIHSVVIEQAVTSIGDYAFIGCSSLTSITIPEGVTSIGDYAFYDCTSLTSITIPNGVTSIGNCAFIGCSSLTSITIPDGVTSIEGATFYGCSSLTSITIPESVTSIGESAFRNCSSLTSITIPESVTSIEKETFSHCSSLTSITIPNGVTSIGDYAFICCSGLASLFFNGDAPTIDTTAFLGVNAVAFYPAGNATWESKKLDYGGTLYWSAMELNTEIIATGICGENMMWQLSKGGVLTIKGSGTFKDFTLWKSYKPMIQQVIFSAAIEVPTIPANSFYGYQHLRTITLPDNVTSIGYRAFSDCTSLTSITIPNGVTSIGDSAFSGCSSLTSITIPNSVTSIGDHAFYGCTSLTSITIPDNVTSIGGRAFEDCTSLTSITIPKRVTSIGNTAFGSCNSLKVVAFLGEKPSINSSAFAGVTADAYYPESLDSDSSWKKSGALSDYGGTLNWRPWYTLGGNLFCEHVLEDTVVPPTCTWGYTLHKCACGYSYRSDFEPGSGHDWGEPVYEWADDHSAITATRVCKRDPDHAETENGVVTSAVTKEATYDAEGEITYTATFANPAFEPQTAAVSLPHLERPAPTPAENPFTDVKSGSYYYDAVLWAVEQGVTAGTSPTTFSPDEGCTRAQVVTFLWRAAGKPDPASSESPFSDVKEGAYYYNAVLWAVENGITNGTSDKTFSPDETCTRAQIVTFLWRYEEQPAPAGTNNPFADVKPSAYFGSAVLWAVEKGITNGTSATTFDPEDTCTRAQVVTFLYRDIVKS